MYDSDLDLEAMELAHDFLTDEQMDEILAIEEEFGVDISLDEILSETEDEEDSEWAE